MSGFSVRKMAIWMMVLSLGGAIGYSQYNSFVAPAVAEQSHAQLSAAQNDAITANMEKLMAGQEGAHVQTGRYATDINQVPVQDRDTRIGVTILVSSDGQSYVMISHSQSGQYAYAVSGSAKVIWSPVGEQLDSTSEMQAANLTLPAGIAAIPQIS